MDLRAPKSAPTHYLRRNETAWSPPNVAFFDTETTPVTLGEREELRLRLWCADALRRRTPAGPNTVDRTGEGTTGGELAAWVVAQLRGVTTLWLFAHNLSFDLTTTRLLFHLFALGFSVTEFGSTDHAPWFRLAKGHKRLTITDTWSWLPAALERIGQQVGVEKPALPDFSAADAAWYGRCRGDVAVTKAAILALMDWWDAADLGRWSITGAASGWNAMRHRMGAEKVLVEPDPKAIAFERQCVRGGRRDVWRFGTLAEGSYLELDIERAHSTTVEHFGLPRKRLSHFDALPLDDPLWDRDYLGALARCRVQTTAPRWPMQATGATWWPVGEFWTVLCGPELARAREVGDLVEVADGWRYLLGDHLVPWARWCNTVAAGQTPAAPAVATLAAKSWGRTVTGKWAGHKATVRPAGPALQPVWGIEKAHTRTHDVKARIVTLGDERFYVRLGLDADNCFPAVLAWVEAHERVALAKMVEALPERSLVACDTDGLTCDLEVAVHHPTVRKRTRRLPTTAPSRAQLVCDWLTELAAPYTVRPKRLVSAIALAGPQAQWLDRKKKLSGIPGSATEAPTGRLVAKLWPKLWWQVSRGTVGAYVRPTARLEAPVNVAHRWVLADETPWPVTARCWPTGRNELVGWKEAQSLAPSAELFRVQHRVLERLR